MMSLAPMRAILVSVFFLFLFLVSDGQKRFIYIQSEGNHPFYVKLAGKLFTSSEAGYLIIPRLDAGSYEIAFGFPKNQWPDQRITCAIKDADAGYQLKYFGSRGWGLLNLQTAQILFMQPAAVPVADTSNRIMADSFARTLAAVVGDYSILQGQLRAGKDSMPNPVQVPATTIAVPVAVRSPSVQAPLHVIRRIDEEKQADRIRLRYSDSSIRGMDTIEVLIPLSETKVVKADSLPINPAPVVSVNATSIKEKTPQFLDIEISNPYLPAESQRRAADTLVATSGKVTSNRESCKQTATEKDFLNLRKQMAAGKTDAEMISIALKRFRTICYSTGQIKNLGSLFLTDEGKYRLYVAAYPFVSDLEQFGSLGSQLTDSYYVARFRAMIQQ